MMLRQLSLLLYVAGALGAPVVTEEFARRQLNGILGSVTGFLGLNATFDYVVVGGGTAGLVMAERLSEDPNVQVAVIEAGTYYQASSPVLQQTPAGDVLFVGSDPSDTQPLEDWSFLTSPQAGANGRTLHYARGKTLGGSSARNFMIYQRPTVQSLQIWADQVNDQSYTFNNFLPYFKKSMKFTPPNTSKRAANASAKYNAAAFDSAGGPLSASYANFAQPFSSYMQGALQEIGVADTQDFNSGKLLGCQYCSSTIDPAHETRDSSQTSFLNSAATRDNLKVYDLTLAKKILFDSKKVATGVSVLSNSTLYTLTAKKEVIVSAGAFQSPQLLMVSGIGPKAALDQFKIPVIADRAGVGQGMQDHVFFGPTYRVNVETFTKLANDPTYIATEFAGEYTTKQEGPLTNPVADFLGWEKVNRSSLSSQAQSDLKAFPADWPEMEYLSGAGYIGDFHNLFTSQPKDGYQYATILGGLISPLSRGTITLKSADTVDPPIINPNWLTHPTDVEVAVAIFKRVRQAFASKFMSKVLTDKTEYFPGPKVQTDAQILTNIRDTVMTIWHAACTCRMGKTSDASAVVDSNARVIGVSGVRVVDASSFPLLVPGHPQSTIYALAEKIAAQIVAGK